MNETKLLSTDELKTAKGIRFSRQHLHKLIRAGRFPKPVKLGPATNGFLESEIDAWIIARVKERDQQPSAA